MEAVRGFHDLTAAAGNGRSPRVDRCVGGTVGNRVSAEYCVVLMKKMKINK